MKRYEVVEENGLIFIEDTVNKQRITTPEAAEMLNEAMSAEDRRDMSAFVQGCEQKLHSDLVDKTLEILMTPIMESQNKDLVETVEKLARGTTADEACANLLRRAIYLKTLQKVQGENN